MRQRTVNSTKSVFVALLFLSVLLAAGCATFKSDIHGRFNSPAEKNYGAEGVSVFFIFSHFRQTKGFDAIPKLDNQRQRISGFDDFFQDALNELTNVKIYATFTEYASDVNDPARRAARDSLAAQHDFVIKMRFMREKSFARHFLGSIGSAVSLTMLPIPYSFSYSLNVDIHDAKGQLVKSYARKASLTKWVQTFMIFIYPFHPERRKKEELYVEFMHDVLRQIETEKVLRRSL